MKSASLYAIQFRHGVVKVGVASNTRIRLRSLMYSMFKGRVVESYASTPRMEYMAFRAEIQLLDRLSRIYVNAGGKEAFFCTDFPAVVGLMRQVMRGFEPESKGWRVFHRMQPFPFCKRNPKTVSVT